MKQYKIAVIGSGIVGLCAALGVSRLFEHNECVLIAPQKPEPDGKTSALLAETVEFLKLLEVWDAASHFAFPLKTMRIIDGTNRLIRAPQTDFKASEIGREAFGYNVENKKLGILLEGVLDKSTSVDRISSTATSVKPVNNPSSDNTYQISIADHGDIKADLIIAADGRNSIARKSSGIGERHWEYPQIALVGNFSHTLSHHDTSTEFHTETGPFTLVPLGKNRSSLVCVVDSQTAQHLLAMEQPELNRYLETKMQSILGKIEVETRLKSFPLSAMVAKRFASGGILFAGEAAHVFPPIGAQGLNLGLRDVKKALELVEKYRTSNLEHTSGKIGDEYHSARAADIVTRTASVDLLNRSLLSGFLPVQAARSMGLYTLGSFGALRRFMMREGIAPGSGSKPNTDNPIKSLLEKLPVPLRK